MVLPPITKQQQTILLLLYRFRFLNRIHIQTLLHHKTFNRINVWLKDLTGKNYIAKIADIESKINIIPSKYYLSVNGIRHLKTQPTSEIKYLSKLYRESKRSEAFINQCLFIADIYIYLSKKYTSDFSFYTQSDYSLHGLIKELFPLFVFRKRGNEPYFLVEIFREKPPKKAYIPRLEKYIQFATKGQWTMQELQPKILLICPDSKLRKAIYRETKNLLIDENTDNLEVFITTKDQIENKSIESEIWEKIEQ